MCVLCLICSQILIFLFFVFVLLFRMVPLNCRCDKWNERISNEEFWEEMHSITYIDLKISHINLFDKHIQYTHLFIYWSRSFENKRFFFCEYAQEKSENQKTPFCVWLSFYLHLAIFAVTQNKFSQSLYFRIVSLSTWRLTTWFADEGNNKKKSNAHSMKLPWCFRMKIELIAFLNDD